jgi:NitT/TauT family transport system substrate-binding protein
MARLLQPQRHLSAWAGIVLGWAAVLALAGCTPGGPRPDTSTRPPAAAAPAIRLQLDWYPQAEHGGFYQALARGFYQQAGLDVEILPGGPGAFIMQKLVTERVDVAIGRSDDVFAAVGEGMPVVIVGVFMQRDPLCLLVHEDDPVRTFADLNGRAVMAHPGAAWVRHVEATLGITIHLVPMNYGLARFLADPTFIQQGYITNEVFVAQRAGARVRTLLLAESGNESLRVIFTRRPLLREHPLALQAFITASLRGWDDFMHGDPAPAKTLIRARHESLDAEVFDHAREALRTHRLVDGDPGRGEAPGLLSRPRLQRQLDQLRAVKLVREDLQLDEAVSFAFPSREAAGEGAATATPPAPTLDPAAIHPRPP